MTDKQDIQAILGNHSSIQAIYEHETKLEYIDIKKILEP